MSNTAEPDLPDTVINAIRANRKVAAIKLLRQERGLDLKDAKDAVDAYIQKNPEAVSSIAPMKESGANPIVVIVILVVAAYLVYRLFA